MNQESKVSSLDEEKNRLVDRVNSLIERLREARNSTNIEEAYKQEVRSQAKMAELYKGELENTNLLYLAEGQPQV